MVTNNFIYGTIYSIMILVVHTLIIGTVTIVVEQIIGVTIDKLYVFIYSIFICWLLIPFMKNFLPYVTAQKDLLSISL